MPHPHHTISFMVRLFFRMGTQAMPYSLITALLLADRWQHNLL